MEIGELRGHIDAIDTEIAALVLQRKHISQRIQQARGGGVDVGREQAIVAGYVAVLGTAGERVAGAVLGACRPDPADVD